MSRISFDIFTTNSNYYPNKYQSDKQDNSIFLNNFVVPGYDIMSDSFRVCMLNTPFLEEKHSNSYPEDKLISSSELSSSSAETSVTASMTAPAVTPPPVITSKDIASSVCSPSLKSFSSNNKVQEVTLENGVTVLKTMYTKFKGVQKEWFDKLKYFQQAADELGLTLVLGEVSRTVAVSNVGRNAKGDVVAPGGSSPHNYGAAVDICLFINGKSVNKTSPIQRKFAQRVIELSNGEVTWGGNFKNKANEEHHFELTGWKNKYKSPENLIR